MHGPSSDKNILISGAGVAGLTCALSLASRGFKVSVYEKAENLEPVGAGLQLSPNVYRVLEQLGLERGLAEKSTFPDAIHVHDGKSGVKITEIPLGETVRKRFGAPYCVIHRGDLQDLLLSECVRNPSISLQFGCEITQAALNGDQVAFTSENRAFSAYGDAAVIADGVWSKSRLNTFNAPPPVYSGKVAWRTLVKATDISDPELMRDTHLWLAPNAHLVTYPVSGGTDLNVILICREPKPDNGRFEAHKLKSRKHLAAKFGYLQNQLVSEQSDWTAWPLFETPRPIQLHRDRLAMIGDAAHSMLPFAAQGAGMAIEDAWVLADCLSEHSIREGFREFALQRKKRVERVMNLARSNGRIYHMSPPLSYCRNLAMGLLPGSKLLERQAWLYNWRG